MIKKRTLDNTTKDLSRWKLVLVDSKEKYKFETVQSSSLELIIIKRFVYFLKHFVRKSPPQTNVRIK